MGDVTVSDCSVTSQYGFMSCHATVKITNTTNITDKTQSYLESGTKWGRQATSAVDLWVGAGRPG